MQYTQWASGSCNRTYQYVGVLPDVEVELDRARICREGVLRLAAQDAGELNKAIEVATAKAKLWQGE